MSKTIVGIDIGHKGAIVVLCADKTIMIFDTPIVDTDDGIKYNIKRLVEIMAIIKKEEDPIVFIEKAITLPFGSKKAKTGFTIKSPTSLAYCEGIFETLVNVFEIPYRFVHPRTWQAVMKVNKKGIDSKKQSMKLAKELFPHVTLETKRGRQLDGRADAILIASYGLQLLEKESKMIFNG